MLFAMSYGFVGDLSDTVALMWPVPVTNVTVPVPELQRIVEVLGSTPKAQIKAQIS